MTGHHADGVMSGIGHHARHLIITYVTGREILIGLGVVLLIIVLLVLPVLGEGMFDSFSAAAEKAGKPVFLTGAGVVVIGLLSGAALLTGIGLGLIGLVVAGWLMINY